MPTPLGLTLRAVALRSTVLPLGAILRLVGLRQSVLSALTFSSVAFVADTPATGTIGGATTGTTITATGLPTGLTINGAARTFAYDGTGAAGTSNVTLTETLPVPGAASQVRSTVVAVTIT